jgi:PPP family 3-phenylpropionic acid transporter
LKVALLLAFASVLFAPWVSGFAGMALILWIQASPRSIVIPLIDTTSIREVGTSGYGRLRLWGSLGYGVVVALFGFLAQRSSYEVAGKMAVPSYLLMLGLATVAVMALPKDDAPSATRPQMRQMARLAANPVLLFFLGVHALHFASIMFYNIFLSVHLRGLGHDPSIPGFAVMVAIVGEVLALFVFGSRATGPQMKAWSLVVMPLTALRWVAMAIFTDAWILVAIQVTHFFSYGVWLLGSLEMLGRFGPAEQRAALQGIFAAAVFGAGGVLGTWTGGVIVDVSGTQLAFVAAAGLEVVGAIGLWFFWRRAAASGLLRADG